MATPPLSVTAEPRFEPPSLNCTVPVGVPVAGATGLTVAVNVTDWPKTDGFVDEATVVVVAATAVTTGEVPILVGVPPLCFVFVVNVFGPAAVGAVTPLKVTVN